MIESTITELADKLGRAMAESGRTRTFKAARQAAMADKDAQAVLKAYQDHLTALARKEQAKQPIEVEDKRALADLQEKIYRNEKLKTLMAAQADYVEMIQKVNERIGSFLVTPEDVATEKKPD